MHDTTTKPWLNIKGHSICGFTNHINCKLIVKWRFKCSASPVYHLYSDFPGMCRSNGVSLPPIYRMSTMNVLIWSSPTILIKLIISWLLSSVRTSPRLRCTSCSTTSARIAHNFSPGYSQSWPAIHVWLEWNCWGKQIYMYIQIPPQYISRSCVSDCFPML